MSGAVPQGAAVQGSRAQDDPAQADGAHGDPAQGDPAQGGSGPLRLDLPGGIVQIDAAPERAALLAELGELWGHVAVDAEDGRPIRSRLLLTRPGTPRDPHADGGVQVIGVDQGPGGAYRVSGEVTRVVISHLIGQQLLLHAGAVRAPGIGVVMVVGPSGAGKSTATSVLARGGAYLTDELTIIDPGARTIRAYPKPVSRIAEADGERVKQDLRLESLGLRPERHGEAPARVVLLSRLREDADELESADEVLLPGELASAADPVAEGVHPVPLADAVVHLVEQSSSVWELPDPLGTLARVIIGAGGAVRAVYREAESLPEMIRDSLGAGAGADTGSGAMSGGEPGGPPGGEEPWETVPGEAERAPAPGQVASAAFTQGLCTRTGTVVLTEGGVARLDGLTALVWDVLLEIGPTAPAVLVGALEEQLGAHPDGEALTLQALEELIGASLVLRGQ